MIDFEDLDRLLSESLSLYKPAGDGGNSRQIGQNRSDAFTPTVRPSSGKQSLHLVQAFARNMRYRVSFQFFADAILGRFTHIFGKLNRRKVAFLKQETPNYAARNEVANDF